MGLLQLDTGIRHLCHSGWSPQAINCVALHHSVSLVTGFLIPRPRQAGFSCSVPAAPIEMPQPLSTALGTRPMETQHRPVWGSKVWDRVSGSLNKESAAQPHPAVWFPATQAGVCAAVQISPTGEAADIVVESRAPCST